MEPKALESLKKTYVSKPIRIEAMKFDGTNDSASAICAAWLGELTIGVGEDNKLGIEGAYLVLTRDSSLVVPGDMVCRNVAGQPEWDAPFTLPAEGFLDLFGEVED